MSLIESEWTSLAEELARELESFRALQQYSRRVAFAEELLRGQNDSHLGARAE